MKTNEERDAESEEFRKRFEAKYDRPPTYGEWYSDYETATKSQRLRESHRLVNHHLFD